MAPGGVGVPEGGVGASDRLVGEGGVPVLHHPGVLLAPLETPLGVPQGQAREPGLDGCPCDQVLGAGVVFGPAGLEPVMRRGVGGVHESLALDHRAVGVGLARHEGLPDLVVEGGGEAAVQVVLGDERVPLTPSLCAIAHEPILAA